MEPTARLDLARSLRFLTRYSQRSLFLERLSFGSVLHRRFLSGKHPQIPLGVGGTTSTFTNARDYARVPLFDAKDYLHSPFRCARNPTQREVTLLRDIQELSAPEARRAGSRVRSTR